MAIQHRRGVFERFNPKKLLPGEWAVVVNGDPSVDDGRACYICFAAGDVKRMFTYEDASIEVKRLVKALEEEFVTDVNRATADADKATATANASEKNRDTAEQARAKAEAARVEADKQREVRQLKNDTDQVQNNAAANSATAAASVAASAANSAAQSADSNAQVASGAAAAANSAAQQASAAAANAKPYYFQAAEPPRAKRVDGMLWLHCNESAKTAVAKRWDANLPGKAVFPGASTMPGASTVIDEIGAWTQFAL